MKIIKSVFFIILSLVLTISCSKNQDNRAEVRFVDLKGNARPIKTRIPEANAKILSGQIPQNSVIEREYNKNEKLTADLTTKKTNRDAFDDYQLKNSPVPKFSEEDVYRKSSVPKLMVENNINSEPENPLIEYDLNEEKTSTNITNTKKLSQTSRQISDNEYIDKSSSITDSTTSNPREVFNDQGTSKTTSKTRKIITYSSKNVKKSTNDDSSQSSDIYENNIASNTNDQNSFESSEESSETNSSISNIEIIDESKSASYSRYSKRGKYYVQVGAFLNSQSAKNKIDAMEKFKNGKIFIGYKNNSRLYRSVYGPFKTKTQANNFKNKIQSSGSDAIVIRGK